MSFFVFVFNVLQSATILSLGLTLHSGGTYTQQTDFDSSAPTKQLLIYNKSPTFNERGPRLPDFGRPRAVSTIVVIP